MNSTCAMKSVDADISVVMVPVTRIIQQGYNQSKKIPKKFFVEMGIRGYIIYHGGRSPKRKTLPDGSPQSRFDDRPTDRKKGHGTSQYWILTKVNF